MVSQTRNQIILTHCIAYLEAHLEPLRAETYRKVVEDLIEAIDAEFPERSGADLEAATKAFLRSWGGNYWPKMGKLIRGLTKHMPPLPASKQIGAPQKKPDIEGWARQVMRSEIGQEAIRRGIASWLWDWCIKQRQPRGGLPSNLLDQLGKRDTQWQQSMAKAAAGSPGPLTSNETPSAETKGWANLGLDVNKRREVSLAAEYGRTSSD